METKNLGKSIREIFDGQNKYVIPLYQRNFSWRREQIEQLLQDIFSAFKQTPTGNYYIGSLVVLKRSNGDFEVVDGQQRLTVLSLITKIMGVNNEPRLFYDSRPEVEEFFNAFYNSSDGSCVIEYPQTAHLKNAIDYIKESKLDAEDLNHTILEADNIKYEKSNICFRQYFEDHVILVRVEIPQDTDVASYFEIMNNRGAQLQKHEILKSFLLSKLNDYSHEEFSKIWTACSQMDTPIQKLFNFDDRCKYFGDQYDKFVFESLSKIVTCASDESNEQSIDEILREVTIKKDKISNNQDSDENDDETKYKSIIDFPNFLMHVFKVLFPDKDISLNEKNLIDTYKSVEGELDSGVFIQKMLFCRTILDRYIVKTVIDNKAEDGEQWTLKKPKKNNNNALDYENTFCDEVQNRIVKALTMLQVTFRPRIYKNWLFEVLKWFDDQGSIDVLDIDYINKLDTIILDKYNTNVITNSPLNETEMMTKDNSYSKGVNTPHFLFNFIDYLYWVDSKNPTPIIENSRKVKPFDFKYWNSVEHHIAREWAARNADKIPNYEQFIDNIGNLCLISKSANSRLSDRDTKEKAETFDTGNLGANRQIIYEITKENNGNYREEQIKQHYNELLELLNNREKILCVKLDK